MNIVFLKSSHGIRLYAAGFPWLHKYIAWFKVEFLLSFNYDILLRIFNILT